jgi:hypothetical protein
MISNVTISKVLEKLQFEKSNGKGQLGCSHYYQNGPRVNAKQGPG